jgi:hypothetical protein
MRENARAARLELPDDVLEELEQLIPLGPAFAYSRARAALKRSISSAVL